jgi:hypothetical protein
MNVDNDKLDLQWGREGLKITYDGNYVETLNITDISLLDLPYGGDLDICSSGYPITRRETVKILLGHRADGPAMISITPVADKGV